MESPSTGLRVTATFTRGHEVEWWEWEFDGEAYVNVTDRGTYTPVHLLALVALKQAEGWQLCRQVV